MRTATNRSRLLCRGIIAVPVFVFLVAGLPSCSIAAGNYANHVAGPLSVDGPLTVEGPLDVAGPLIVHGPVKALRFSVAGPLDTSMPKNETPGQAGQLVPGGLSVAGPLYVNGPLSVDGMIHAAGPMHCESASETTQGLESSQSSQITE
jgi:cytoskeletal protein CcmA (bactofilin family)